MAENETMGVTLVKAAPEVSRDPMYLREERPHNLLRWDLELDPDMNGEKAQTIGYEFKLELDRQMTIGSVQNKGPPAARPARTPAGRPGNPLRRTPATEIPRPVI